MGRLTIQEKTFIKEHPEMTNKELAELFHHDRHTIGNYKKKLGIAFSQTHDFSKYNSYIIENYYSKTSRELAQEIGCSNEYVTSVWLKAGFSGKTNRKYYSNFNYFHNIDCENKAYLIGLLASDGNLYKRDGHEGQIQLSLHIKDIKLLQNILIILNSNNPIKIYKNYATITFVSDIMYNDLCKIGLSDNKTWNLQLEKIINNIPEKYWKDFLRGYFDGDGSISGKNIPSSYNITFAIPKNISKKFLEIIEKCIQEKYLFIEDHHHKYKFPFGSLIAKNSTQKYKLLKIMYEYENPELYLERKFILAKKLIALIEENSTNREENITAVVKWGELLENLKWQSAAKP